MSSLNFSEFPKLMDGPYANSTSFRAMSVVWTHRDKTPAFWILKSADCLRLVYRHHVYYKLMIHYMDAL